jgi:hypothetical protein
MACPPGMILNPHTLRCISSRGRIARELVKVGNIDAGELRLGVGYGEPLRRRHRNRHTVRAPRSPALYGFPQGPGPGLRPTLGAFPAPAEQLRYPAHSILRAACDPGFEQNPRTGRCIRVGGRTFKRLYEGARAAPILEPTALAPPRLPLGAGPVQPQPQPQPQPKPRHRATAPPPEWKLYVASDQASGPNYATVGYVDTTRGRRTAQGIVYGPDAFRVNMGFLPLFVSPVTGGCSIRVVVELLQRAAAANKLLVPAAGGWRPIAGFPFTKSDWEDGMKAQRLGRLCKDLARALSAPL